MFLFFVSRGSHYVVPPDPAKNSQLKRGSLIILFSGGSLLGNFVMFANFQLLLLKRKNMNITSKTRRRGREQPDSSTLRLPGQSVSIYKTRYDAVTPDWDIDDLWVIYIYHISAPR